MESQVLGFKDNCVLYTLYIVRCKTPHVFYVGITQHYENRIRNHSIGNGSSATKKHGFKKSYIIAQFPDKTLAQHYEKLLVLRMRERGYRNTFGAGFTQVNNKK